MEHDHVADVSRLRDDIDLGLHMAERLAAIGEPAAAVRLVDEMRTLAADVLGPVPQTAQPPADHAAGSGRRFRRAIVIGTAAAALGIGSAAALVSPPDTSERSPAPSEGSSSVARPGPVDTADAAVQVPDDRTSTQPDAVQVATVPAPADAPTANTAGTATEEGDPGDGLLPNDLRSPTKQLPDPVLEEPQPIVTP